MTAYEQAKEAAWQARISLTTLCERAGVDYATVWRWKRGKFEAHPATLKKLLDKAAAIQKAAKAKKVKK